MFEKGNTHAAKRRKFEEALTRALASDDWARLRQCAETVLDLAAGGERWAVELLRDTLDGKPSQQIVATDAEGRGLTVVLADLSNITASRIEDCPALPLHSETLPAAGINGVQERH